MCTPKAQPKLNARHSIFAMFPRANTPETGIPATQMANAVIDPHTGKTLEYRHLMAEEKSKRLWTRSFANELGRLAQGVGDRVKGTDTIFFIRKDEVPIDRRRDVTYGRIVVDIRPQKQEK